MRIAKVALILLTVPALNACNDVNPIEFSRFEAWTSCLDRAGTQLGLPTSDSEVQPETVANQVSSESAVDSDAHDDVMFEKGKPIVRIASTGQFVAEFGTITLPKPYPSFTLTCTGDINARTFTSMQINGAVYRPKSGERWTIGTNGIGPGQRKS